MKFWIRKIGCLMSWTRYSGGLNRAQIRLIWFCLLGTVTYVLYPLYFLFISRHIFYNHTENPKNDHHCEICDKYFFCLSDLKVHTNKSSLISESFSFVQNMCQFTILSTIHFSIMNLLLRLFEATGCLKTLYLCLVNSELLVTWHIFWTKMKKKI